LNLSEISSGNFFLDTQKTILKVNKQL